MGPKCVNGPKNMEIEEIQLLRHIGFGHKLGPHEQSETTEKSMKYCCHRHQDKRCLRIQMEQSFGAQTFCTFVMAQTKPNLADAGKKTNK